METIRRNSTGSTVSLWQSTLNEFRRPTAWIDAYGQTQRWNEAWGWPLPVDGKFDEGTEAATQAWQVGHGLVADGIVGPKTWNAAGAQTEASLGDASSSYSFMEAKNYSRGRNQAIRLIIVHTTEAREDKPKSASGSAGWFKNQPARGTRVDDKLRPDPNGTKIWGGTSAHYCVDREQILQCVRDGDVAWHAGPVNGYSIGVEHAGTATQTEKEWADADSTAILDRSALLVAALCAEYGIEPRRLSLDELRSGASGIAGHGDVTVAFGTVGGHSDPGPNFPWASYVGSVRQALGLAPEVPRGPEPEPPGGWFEVELDGETWEVAGNYIYGVSLAEAAATARGLGCELPSPALVDAIWELANVKLDATELRRSDFVKWTMAEMSSPTVLEDQRQKIDAKADAQAAAMPGKPILRAGSHKDVVLSSDGRLGLYGWQDSKGKPLQPFYAGHTPSWRDYSQGLRLVRRLGQSEAPGTRSGQQAAPLVAAALLEVPVAALMGDGTRTRSRGASGGPTRDLPVATARDIEIIQADLDADPEGTLARAQTILDGKLTEERLRQGLDAAKAMLADQTGTARSLTETRTRSRGKNLIPPEFGFEGYDPAAIPLDVESTKFETHGDLPGWFFLSGSAIVGGAFGKKARFERHSHERLFHYARPAPTATAPVRVALFSDFATGLAHSRYIAKHLTRDAATYDAAIHLGDVYYAGRQAEVDEYLVKPLADLTRQTTLLTLPGNHEMYSNGHAFFGAIHDRRRDYPSRQIQEGSYFSLSYGKHLQLIGIDTDYFGHARYEDAELLTWLEMVLRWGREEGRTNVLLSGNEPFTYGETAAKKLYHDLSPMLPMVDLWFWGNDHYCALFDRTAGLPITSCIGHGGYPYHLSEYGLDEAMTRGAGGFAPSVWAEAEPRYPRYTGVRQELGNNGYVELEAYLDGRIRLIYKDWTARVRKEAILARDATRRLAIESLK